MPGQRLDDPVPNIAADVSMPELVGDADFAADLQPVDSAKCDATGRRGSVPKTFVFDTMPLTGAKYRRRKCQNMMPTQKGTHGTENRLLRACQHARAWSASLIRYQV